MSHGMRMNESWHVYEWVMALEVVLGGTMTREQTTYSYTCCDLSSSSAMTLSYVCDMTHPHVCHGSSICVSWLIYRVMTYLSGAMTRVLTCVTRLIHMYVTWLIHMCAMTHFYACRDISIVSWLILVVLWLECRHDSSIRVCHDSLIRVSRLIYMCAMTRDDLSSWLVSMCAVTLCAMTLYVCCHSVCYDSICVL